MSISIGSKSTLYIVRVYRHVHTFFAFRFKSESARSCICVHCCRITYMCNEYVYISHWQLGVPFFGLRLLRIRRAIVCGTGVRVPSCVFLCRLAMLDIARGVCMTINNKSAINLKSINTCASGLESPIVRSSGRVYHNRLKY